ncbi:hypothetical protein MSG28_014055 [Choristoneura fumiferana]|uniref:Uncharacterized protein n=1 Tax=Choristoneura fumiferana TaxID=7141 RepID=A0ACC0JFT3_CHOFU|nr:hypothetical protein MSG28_014055 [Choristoneura fumiferana]
MTFVTSLLGSIEWPRESHPARSRVLCLPLYTVLLAAEATRAEYLLLAGPPHLAHVPFDKVRLQVIEYRSTDMASRNQTTQFLLTKNYTVAATFDDSIMYALQP